MGEVYRAEHKELQTPVAVKLLNDDISENHDHVQRFFNEARIVSKIKHAGIVKIFDSGFHNEPRVPDHGAARGRVARGPDRARSHCPPIRWSTSRARSRACSTRPTARA